LSIENVKSRSASWLRFAISAGVPFSRVSCEISKMSELGPDRYVRTLVERLPHARRTPALRGALVVASADGLAPEEERMFRDVAVELGIDTATADAMLAEVRDPS
jgi:hypothetical protein